MNPYPFSPLNHFTVPVANGNSPPSTAGVVPAYDAEPRPCSRKSRGSCTTTGLRLPSRAHPIQPGPGTPGPVSAARPLAVLALGGADRVAEDDRRRQDDRPGGEEADDEPGLQGGEPPGGPHGEHDDGGAEQGVPEPLPVAREAGDAGTAGEGGVGGRHRGRAYRDLVRVAIVGTELCALDRRGGGLEHVVLRWAD